MSQDDPQITTVPTGPAGAPASTGPQAIAERPEVLVGAAFAGAFVVARILKSIFD